MGYGSWETPRMEATVKAELDKSSVPSAEVQAFIVIGKAKCPDPVGDWFKEGNNAIILICVAVGIVLLWCIYYFCAQAAEAVGAPGTKM